MSAIYRRTKTVSGVSSKSYTAWRSILRDMKNLRNFLTARGCVVIGEDHMGHGKSVGKYGKYGYFCEQDPATVLVRDVHRLKKATVELYPNVPYVIVGHSMGSFIVRNYMFRYGKGIDAAVIMGTGMPRKAVLVISRTLAAAQRILLGAGKKGKLLDKLAFGSYNRHIQNPKTPFDWLSREGERVKQYLEDPMCGFVFTINGFETLFELISRLYHAENLERIPKKMPVFCSREMTTRWATMGKA